VTVMCTKGTEHIRACDFRDWLVTAKPGDKLVYCTGALATSIQKAHMAKDATAGVLSALQEAAWQARTKAHLIQRRVGPKVFDYIAIKRIDGMQISR